MSTGIPPTVYDAIELVIREHGADDAHDYLRRRFHEADHDDKMRVARGISAYRRRFA